MAEPHRPLNTSFGRSVYLSDYADFMILKAP